MKTRCKIILIMIATIIATAGVQGQEFKRTLGSTATISIHSLFGELYIEGVSGNDLVISTDDYEKPPPRADGLKPLYSTGVDNTEIGLSVQEEGNQVTITGASKQSQDATYHLKVPATVDLSVDLSGPFAEDIKITGVSGELDIKSLNADIKLVDITGPAVIHSVSGTIEGNFSTISQDNPSSISTVSGVIDLALPAGGPANLEIATTTGEAYSDLDLALEKAGEEGMARIGGSVIKGKLGAGGVTLKITSISGEIFLRKK